ncbi:MAG: primosomal protein N' [Chitinispirillales bacterium]|nr:primosomal protein N' [Chitinispirillales bacterium]
MAFPVAIPGIYDYEIPDRFVDRITPGQPVLVEVKKSRIWGVAVEIKTESAVAGKVRLKEVIDIKEGHWADSNRSLLKLYEWIARYYQCPVGRVFRPVAGKSIINKKARTVTVYRCVDTANGVFIDNGIDANVNINMNPGINTDSARRGLSDNQRIALEKIKSHPEPLSAAQLQARFGIAASTLASLRKKGYLSKEIKTEFRDAGELSRSSVDEENITLSHEQRDCVERVAASLSAPDKPFLLYGITGSGKTHVYTELAKRVLSAGRGVIILVPEISLTPQTISRFRAAIGDAVTVIHSRMSDGERRDSLQEIVTGRRRAVVGVRSALLCPMEDVGLIVVDEEHDGSYKQSDTDPRYNARDAAVMRGRLQGAAVVLGSATPSLESYCNALTGKYRLLTLTDRFGTARLPAVKIVDMTVEHREKNWTALSRYLAARLEEELSLGRQAILLLNRRGFSTSLLCKDCGYSHACPNCSVNLRYHKADTVLKCHLCGHEEPALTSCPKCGGLKIHYKGTGIQKAEEMLRERFPGARILRMDQDTTRRKGSHAAILDAFASGGADILIGTQMVAKGLNFPNVTLVGVLHADTGLHFPDFRASERTFQLLTQVAGRAGRAELAGEVVIQTYCPNDAAVRFAAEHDYLSFYGHEIKHRKELSYPPFGKIARVVVEGPDESVVAGFIGKAARMIAGVNAGVNVNNAANAGVGAGKIKVLGPTVAVLARVDNVYRYSMFLKSGSPGHIGDVLADVRKLAAAGLPSGCKCIVDVDPQNML